jgi:Mrp family chromosome partitioning ATPase/capsular polysaccharide biosynthesis protein
LWPTFSKDGWSPATDGSNKPMNDTTDAAAIFAPLWKRKWLILLLALVVGGASYVYYKRQPIVFSASTQLNLASGSEEQSLAGGQSKAGVAKAAISDAVTIITSGLVGQEAHRLLLAEHATVKGKVRAKLGATGSDIVTISAEAHGAKHAASLANAYAVAYIKRERASYVRAIESAITNTRHQLRRIELASTSGKGKGQSTTNGTAVIQEASLSSKLNQLESDLTVSSIQQLSPAKASTAELIEPEPKKSAIFGFALGLVLGMIAVFIVERFDRSLRSLASVASVFRAPILTALPKVRLPITETDGRPRPAKPLVEPVRRVNTTLRLREPLPEQAAPCVILCTSPDAGDGKSTLVAAMALVRRDAGERVAVVEADFHRPVLAQLLGVSAGPGLADVLRGARSVEEALQTVPATARSSELEGVESGTASSTMVRTRTAGSLSVLVGGTFDDGSQLNTSHALAELLSSLAEDHDCVLVDAPSPLEVSDTVPLLGAVDGTIVIVRLGHTRDVSAARLAELLELPSVAPTLGVIVSDVSRRELASSGFTVASRRQSRSRSLIRR